MHHRRKVSLSPIASHPLRQLIQRNFNPGDRTAGAAGLTISNGDSHMIKTRWKRQGLSPLDEAPIFGEYFPWDLNFFPETREAHLLEAPRMTNAAGRSFVGDIDRSAWEQIREELAGAR